MINMPAPCFTWDKQKGRDRLRNRSSEFHNAPKTILGRTLIWLPAVSGRHMPRVSVRFRRRFLPVVIGSPWPEVAPYLIVGFTQRWELFG